LSDPQTILRVPCQKTHIPDDASRHRIASYFAGLVGKGVREVQKRLPQVMVRWGKVRVIDGDSISSSWVDQRRSEEGRCTSFFETEVKDKGHSGAWVPRIFYGELDEILVCKLPGDRKFWRHFAGQVRLLADITPYRTGSRDAALEIVAHHQPTAPVIVDIQSVTAVVGRLQTRGTWHLLDRTGGMVRPEFVPSDELEVEEEMGDVY
ncbi:hypothetical protein B0H16DRAFT_1335362, partial [Mycena metata]